MNPIIQQAATTYLAPKLMRGFRWQWAAYGVAAYVEIRMMNKRGILPKETDAALNFLHKNFGVGKGAGATSETQSGAH